MADIAANSKAVIATNRTLDKIQDFSEGKSVIATYQSGTEEG